MTGIYEYVYKTRLSEVIQAQIEREERAKQEHELERLYVATTFAVPETTKVFEKMKVTFQ